LVGDALVDTTVLLTSFDAESINNNNSSYHDINLAKEDPNNIISVTKESLMFMNVNEPYARGEVVKRDVGKETAQKAKEKQDIIRDKLSLLPGSDLPGFFLFIYLFKIFSFFQLIVIVVMFLQNKNN
jgi:hypothetical protein